MNDHERVRQENEERARILPEVIHSAYLAIRNGGIYATWNKELYKSVRPRLKRRLEVFKGTDDTLIDRFILLK